MSDLIGLKYAANSCRQKPRYVKPTSNIFHKRRSELILTTQEVEGLEDCGLLHRLPDLTGPASLDLSETQFCFMLLTVREFLVAKHVIDTMKETQEFREFLLIIYTKALENW